MTLYTAAELAELLDVTTRTITNKLTSGEIAGAFKVGTLWKIPSESVHSYLRSIGYPENKLPVK